MEINEGLDKLEKCCTQRRSSPLLSRMETKWENVGQEEKALFKRKATEAGQMVCSAIAPESGGKLFHTFIANRVALIRDGSEPSQWNHVGGDQNPADHAS